MPPASVPLAVMDPALGRTGAHNLGFAELMLARPPGPLGFWCADAIPPAWREQLQAGGANVSPTFGSDFYALYHQAGGVAEHWDWIYSLCRDYLRALRGVLDHWPAGSVQVLHHTLSWEHATALSLALGLLGPAGRRLRHLALLMYSPGVGPDGQVLDRARMVNFQLAFAALERCPGVVLYASCAEHATAYAALLGRQSPLPLHPCFLGDWLEGPTPEKRQPGRVLAYVGEAKQEKGFLDLPARLSRLGADNPSAQVRFVVHCVEARTEAARSVMAKVRRLAQDDPRIRVHEGHWSDERLHDEFARASLACLDYDPAVYAHKTSGLLWLAAWHRVPVSVPEGTWLAREARRMGLPLMPAGGPVRAERARLSPHAADEAYRRAIFQPFHEWLAGQAGATDTAAEARGTVEDDSLAVVHEAMDAATRIPGRPPAASGSVGADIIMFWKQNDSTLYGRRNDMVARYLASRRDVRRVMVVDAPISDRRLAALAAGDGVDQSRWIHDRTLEKLRGDRDADGILYRVFVFDGVRFGDHAHEEADDAFVDAYGDWLAREFERAGVDPARAAFWIYPRDFCLPHLLGRFRPARIVVDMVDDDRAWPGIDEERKQRLGRNYSELLEAADLVLANCAPVQAGLQRYREDVHLVPNGVDEAHGRISGGHRRPPKSGAVIGYVGNLEAKIDIALLDRIATHFHQHKVVLVGSTHANPAVRDLQRHPNVEMPGVVPYDRLGDWLSRFDVAIIPHLEMEMTRRMNPLKTHVYLAWSVPVVSTAVANVDPDGELVRVAANHRDFIQLLEQLLASPRPPAERFRRHVEGNSWRVRLDGVVDRLGLGEVA